MQHISLENKTVLVTGAAGFIGSHLVLELLRTTKAIHIVGIDNMNDYYDVSLKEYRLKEIDALIKEKPDSRWTFVEGSIADKALIDHLFETYHPAVVVNLEGT